MRLLIVKTSSMGDVVHALPVVSDCVRHLPGTSIDWVVEEAFAELPSLHPSVGHVHRVALRRWRHELTHARSWRELRDTRSGIAQRGYDFVLDLQGLLKSAWISSWARGTRIGFGWSSAREPLASVFYHRRFDVPQRLHAIERMRALAAQAFGYRIDSPPRFGLRADQPLSADLKAGIAAGEPRPGYVVLLHATARADKRWPDDRWIALGHDVNRSGSRVVLPWGSPAEQQRARSIAATLPDALVAPRMSLAQAAALLRGARFVVGVDTGLTHLAAALDTPTVALFMATPSWRYGPYWSESAVSLGEGGQWPAADQVMSAALRLERAARPAA